MPQSFKLLWVATLICISTACGGGMVDGSVATLSSARAAIRAADEVGAEEVPQAALHLKHARDQVAEAEVLLEDGEDEDAQRMFQRAESDAEVALALSRRATAENDAAQAERRLAGLRRAVQDGGSSASR